LDDDITGIAMAGWWWAIMVPEEEDGKLQQFCSSLSTGCCGYRQHCVAKHFFFKPDQSIDILSFECDDPLVEWPITILII